MRCPKPAGLLVLTGLLVSGPARAAEPGDGGAAPWRSRIEFFTQFLQDYPSRVVRDHLVAIASGLATLTFDYTEGGALILSLENGELRLDGRVAGRYPEGGALESAWRRLLLDTSHLDTPSALTALRAWHPDGLSGEEERDAGLLRARAAPLSAPRGALAVPRRVEGAAAGGLTIDLSDLTDPARLAPMLRGAAGLQGAALRITVPGGQVRSGHFSAGSNERVQGPLLVLHGDADIYGTVDGNLAVVEGNAVVHPGGVVTGDVLAVAGQVRDLGGDIQGAIRTLDAPRHRAGGPGVHLSGEPPSAVRRIGRNGAGVIGVFLTLMLLGIGLVLFARPPLEVVSDTVLHSFSRALLVGLLGQVLILPTFGMVVVGLVLSVAGILLVPFAVIVFALLLVIAILGGFLAIAHAMGETLTRRQLALGRKISANSYRYVLVGLSGVMALWLSWVVFGWVPVAGTLIFAMATLVTWLLATVGFGAALLSRAGFREHFAGRLLPAEALTDEYLWATPQFGVPAARRPPRGRTPPPSP